MIEEIRSNVQTEMGIAREIASFEAQRDSSNIPSERAMLEAITNSLRQRLKIINLATMQLISAMSIAKPLVPFEIKTGVESVEIASMGQMGEHVAVRAIDKDRYLKELNISEILLKKVKRKKHVKAEQFEVYKKPSFYAKNANKIFLSKSHELLDKGHFENLNLDLRKGNINILTSTYVSMMFFTTVIAAVIGLFLMMFLLFFNLSFEFPFLQLYDGSYILRLLKIVWLPFVLPLFTWGAMYLYPHMERSSLTSRIDGELPFVVIHMGSISGSGVEPTQIFKIVGLSRDYPHTRGEIRKLLNQINVYGYDLITALKNVARTTSSARLAELLGGLSTTISSGGDLKTFFEKRAETLLLNYRLEREKFTKTAETFMDIYISVVIATPMILLLLLVMISVSGVSVGGFSLGQLSFIIVFVVAIINVIFLWLLSMKQPAY